MVLTVHTEQKTIIGIQIGQDKEECKVSKHKILLVSPLQEVFHLVTAGDQTEHVVVIRCMVVSHTAQLDPAEFHQHHVLALETMELEADTAELESAL